MKPFRRIHIFILLSLLVFSFFIFSLWQNRQRNLKARAWVNHTYEVLNDIYAIASSLKETGSDVRTYLITGDSLYAIKARASGDVLRNQLDHLTPLMEDNQEQQTNLNELKRLVNEELKSNEAIISLPASAGIRNFRNGEFSDSIDRKLMQMRAIEERLLKQRIQRNQDIGLQTLLTNAAFMILTFSALLYMMLQIDRDYQLRKQSEQNMQAFLSSTREGFYMIDKNYRIEVINEQAKELFLKIWNKKVEVGQNILDTVSPERRQYAIDNYNEVLQGAFIDFESKYEFGGKENWFLVHFAPVKNTEGRVTGISVMFRDITDNVEDRRGLIAARNKAEAAERSQEEFLANMSHEIRTPMNGIIGMADLMEKTALNLQQKEFLKVIQISADHLLELINDILDFSKIKAGKLTIDKIDFNLKETIRNTMTTLRSRASQKGLKLYAEMSDQVPEWVEGDPHRLSQVLINLISNGIKFTSSGSVRLRIREKMREGDIAHFEFSVIDTGIGINQHKLARIFESFVQAEENTSVKFGGTGLGLTISKKLIELQGGTISVKSESGWGSEFTFTIPYKIVEAKEDAVQPTQQTSMAPFPEKRVLIVEDNLMNQMVIKQYLRNLEIMTETANNGKIAVDLLRKDHDFDLIILDLRMPEMNGFETAEYIRKELKLSIPIIAFTASALRSEKDRCLEMGMNEYMTKPFKGEELYAQLGKYLGG